MKLSRLSNNQLRRLLREGEVRFGIMNDDEEKFWKEIKLKIYEMLNVIRVKAWPIRYKIESLLAKRGSSNTKTDILKKFKELKITCDALDKITDDIDNWNWDRYIDSHYYK